jgi:glucosamine--fructose-6-phosphate aminotransferase (isomerizing)
VTVSVDALRDQVLSVPELIRETTWDVEERARKVLNTPDLLNLRLAVLAGSGDSHIAARAAQFAWQELGAVPTFADEAMTAARYRLTQVTGGQRLRPMLVAVSHSGEVARIVEAAQHARALGSFVLAVTADANSRLAGAADATLLIPAPPFPPAPGVRSYATTLLALYHLAIRIGEVRGRYTMDEAADRRRQLAGLADLIESTMQAADAAATEIAERWAEYSTVELLGSGPGRASADYGAAKVLEAAGLRAYGQDIEEFAHLHYFVADTASPTVIVAPGNSASRSRAVEVSRLLARLGRPAATLADQPLLGDHLPHAAGVPEIFQPLLHIAPLALLADRLMRLRHEEPGRGGRAGWADSLDGATVRGSAIALPTTQH